MSSYHSRSQSPAMVLTASSSRRSTLDHLFSLNTQPQAKGLDGGSMDLFNTSLSAPPSPAVHSFRYIPQTSYSPPFTPPGLKSGILHEQTDRSCPSTPGLIFPSPSHDEEASFPWSRTANGEFSYTHITLNPSAQPFIPTRTQFAQKHSYRYAPVRRTPQALALVPPRNRPRLSYRAKSDRFFTNSANPCDAHLYSAQFPAGHVLHRDFVRKYSPGGQIGVGAFGFVVTGKDKLLGHEVAVKFIEKGKVPSWGWSYDPEMGHVPTEAVLLKLLNHPGIIKFLDFFQDRVYFYLVQELHGSPWRGKQQLFGPGLHPTNPRLPSSPNELVSSSSAVWKPLSQSLSLDHQAAPNLLCDVSADYGSTTPSNTPSSSSSTFSSPSFSPVSPLSPVSVSPASPLTPPYGARPNMSRRHSHDLFECIEEYQRLSESQARYIFAQIVDVVDYLDSIGVTHRDLKDENVLIDRSFCVKLIDFGAASCVDPRFPRPWYRDFRGTLAYAPAEILKEAEEHQAEPADIWALGILLCYLITGKSAFPTVTDATQGRIMLQNCVVREGGNEGQGVSPQGQSVSSECWHLLTRCLDPDPHTRASIAEVKAHPWLHRALDKVLLPA